MHKLSSTQIGVVSGTLLVLISAILYFFLNYDYRGYSQFGIYFIFSIAIFVAIYNHAAKTRTSSVTNLFSEGFKAFVVMTLLMVVFSYIYFKMNPQILEEAIIENNQLIAKEQDHTPAEIEVNTRRIREIFMPMTISITILKFLLMGTIFSIIFSMLLRKTS